MNYLVISTLLKGWSRTKKKCVHIIHFVISPIAFVMPLHRTFFIRGNANDARNPTSCTFPVLLNTSPVMRKWRSHRLYQWRSHTCFQWNSHSCHHSRKKTTFLFHISYFTVSLVQSIHRPDFSCDSTILIKKEKTKLLWSLS